MQRTIHILYCSGCDNCITALFSFASCSYCYEMVREKKAVGTFHIKCSDEPQLFVTAEVHTAKYREQETIHQYKPIRSRCMLAKKVHPQHWVREEKARNPEITHVVLEGNFLGEIL